MGKTMSRKDTCSDGGYPRLIPARHHHRRIISHRYGGRDNFSPDRGRYRSRCDLPVLPDLFEAGLGQPEEAVGPVTGVDPELQLDLLRWRKQPELGKDPAAFVFNLMYGCGNFFKSYDADKDHPRYHPDKKIADTLIRVRDPHDAAASQCDDDGIIDALGCRPASFHEQGLCRSWTLIIRECSVSYTMKSCEPVWVPETFIVKVRYLIIYIYRMVEVTLMGDVQSR